MSQDISVEVARVNEIPYGKMKHVEVEGKEALIANLGGKFYARSDRCGHMNALLSMGNLTGSTVTCPFHGSKFDVKTGKKLSLHLKRWNRYPKLGKNFLSTWRN
jgi:nitrite reductase/ring-hydroxylating ferredoxin subunit